jgi:hypothetical protein
METQKGHNYLRCTKRMKRKCSQPYVREECMTEQIGEALVKVSLPDYRADWLIERLNAERDEAGGLLGEAKKDIDEQIEKIDKQLDRLTAAYLDAGAFTAAEFRKRKAEALNRKRKLLDDQAALDENQNMRFEPVKRFVNGSKQMKYAAERCDPKEMRKELQTIGSNLTVRDRKLHWFPRGAWKLVVDLGSIAQHNAAPELSGAALVGKSRLYPTEWSDGESNPDLLNAIQPSSR